MTYTYVTMDVSPACFEEILLKLTEAGYDHAIHTERPGFGTKGNPNPVLLDMHGIALNIDPVAAAKERIVGNAGTETQPRILKVSPATFAELWTKQIPGRDAGRGEALHFAHAIIAQQDEPDPTPHADAEGRKQTRAGKPTL